MRTWADPRMVDPTLEPTKRPPNMCYAGEPAKANRSAHGIAAACTLRSWLGMWSLRHAQTRAEPHLARIDCPALVINAEQDTGVFPSDARRIYDALATNDKTLTSIDTDHYFTTPGSAQRAGRYHRQVDRQTVAVMSLAHLRSPGEKVLDFLAPHSDWLDVRFCAEDDDDTFYRELPDAEVIWHVLRPLSGVDLRRAPRLRLVHKLGAGREHHRRGRRDVAGHRGGQHARRQRAVGRRGHGAADAGRAAPAVELDRFDPGRRGLADRSVARARPCATSAAAPSGWSATATSRKRVETIVAAMGADVLHTSTRDDGTDRLASAVGLLADSDIVSLHLPLTERPRACWTATRWRR